MLLGLLLSCAMRAKVSPNDARAKALAVPDAAWAARAEPGQLDSAMDGWIAALAQAPNDPRILQRLARGEWTRGALGEDDVGEHFETGLDYGYRCLLASPAFATAAERQGFRITPEVAAAVPQSASGCLVWTAAAGLSLAEARGPGGTLDLAALGALVARLRALVGDHAEGMELWTQAKVRLLDPASPPEARDEARGLLRQAVATAPGVVFFRAELATAFPDERDPVLADLALPTPDPWALENARALARLAAVGVTPSP